jgi:hypothetical protein
MVEEFHAAFNIHCQFFYSSELICHSCCEEYKDCVQDIIDSYEGCENEEDALEEESTLSLPCSSASDENLVCCLNKESAEIESVLEADTLCNPVSKNPRYEQPIFDSYDDDKILLPGLNLERQPVFNNEEQFSHVGQKIPLGMSFEAPPLFDHYGDNDEDAEVFFVLEEKIISSQLSNESEIFYQEQHDREKEPSIDIHEEISFHQLADVIREGKREVDQQPASTFHSPVLATDIQPYVSNCKAEQAFCYQPSRFYHLFYDPVGEYMELHFLNVLKPPRFILPSSLGGNLKNVISFCHSFVIPC